MNESRNQFPKGKVMDNGASSYRRFLKGDDEAIVEIVRDYKDGLIFYLCEIVGDVYAAEDIMTETFVKLAVKKPRFVAKDATFKTWLYKVARNMALDFLRKRSKISDRPIEDYGNILIGADDVASWYIAKEDARTLHIAMRELKDEYRQVLYLVFFEGFDNRQSASVMKKSVRQIENLLYRAKAALKAELEKKGFVYEGL